MYDFLSLPFTSFPPSSFFLLCLQVHIVRDKVTWPGAIVQKAREGMPNYDNNKVRGTLFITVDVDFPRGEFEDDQKEGNMSLPLVLLPLFLMLVAKVVYLFVVVFLNFSSGLIEILGQDSQTTFYNSL